MESVKDVKEALSARSRTATLDELRSEGRKRVRLIKAEHVAAMITEAVHAAIEQSGLIPQDEVDRLVEASRKEFRDILREREEEARAAHELREEHAAQREQIAELKQQLSAALQARPTAAPASGSPEMMMMMMQELANLKASMLVKEQQAPAAAAGGGGDFAAALEKLSGTLNDRLENIGRKMGISAAVEGDAVKFDGLFRDDGKQLESNLDNVQVKQKAGGGIAANLAKLKKLKGGG